MKRASILICAGIAVVIAQGCRTSAPRAVADNSFLTGVHTVYVDPSLQFYVKRAFEKELPQVHLAADQKSADVTLDYNEQPRLQVSGGTTNATYETVVSATGSSATYQTHTVSVPVGESSVSRGYASGIATRRDGRTMVIHEGFSGGTFTSGFIEDFIRAWRLANPNAS